MLYLLDGIQHRLTFLYQICLTLKDEWKSILDFEKKSVSYK